MVPSAWGTKYYIGIVASVHEKYFKPRESLVQTSSGYTVGQSTARKASTKVKHARALGPFLTDANMRPLNMSLAYANGKRNKAGGRSTPPHTRTCMHAHGQ
ncbi:hypothetical protein TRVL_03202 [Trypanosoma vivax]|nr:hypothetical protein TRVL_03202 [Trypanosoma vivax]